MKISKGVRFSIEENQDSGKKTFKLNNFSFDFAKI